MGRFPLVASVVAVALGVASSASANPILLNGSFELGPAPFDLLDVDIAAGSTVITGWTVTGGGIDLGEDPWDTSDGLRLVDLDGRDALSGGIEQTFATTIAQQYIVSFDLSGNPGDAPWNGLPTIKQVRVSVDGFSQDYYHDSTGQSIRSLLWDSFEFSFVASNTSATLSFVSLTPFPNSYGPLIDNVHVRTVPEPSTLLFVSVGGLAAVLRSRRRVPTIRN